MNKSTFKSIFATLLCQYRLKVPEHSGFCSLHTSLKYYTEDEWINWVDRLSEDNYLVLDDFISDQELDVLMSNFKDHLKEDDFKKAGIGTGDEFQLRTEIRGDYIRWLDPGRDISLHDFFERINEAIYVFNRYCFLSLSGSEFHMAHYPPGTFYKRHLDQFNAVSNRLITVILYLNTHWKEGDGGELQVYLDDEAVKIAPIAKRVVFMRSDMIEHEVLETNKDRYSVTGWLLYQPPGLTFLT